MPASSALAAKSSGESSASSAPETATSARSGGAADRGRLGVAGVVSYSAACVRLVRRPASRAGGLRHHHVAVRVDALATPQRVDAGLRGEGDHRLGVVARDDLDVDAGLGELLERAAHARAELVAEADEGERLEARGEDRRGVGVGAEGGRLVQPGEHDDAQAARGPLVGAPAPVGAGAQRRRQDLGRAEHVRAARLAVGEGEAAPLALGREEGLVRGRQALRRERGAERLDRPVGVGRAGGEGAEQARCARVVGAQPRQLLERHHA